MSTRGRKADLKAIDGGLAGVPVISSGVPNELATEWNAICADLIERKLLTAPAVGLVETYLMARWAARTAQQAIQKHGALIEGAHKALKPNPACGLLAKSLEAVARLGAELGISPAARSKGQFQAKGGQADDGAPADLDI